MTFIQVCFSIIIFCLSGMSFCHYMHLREIERLAARRRGRWELLYHINEFNAAPSYYYGR